MNVHIQNIAVRVCTAIEILLWYIVSIRRAQLRSDRNQYLDNHHTAITCVDASNVFDRDVCAC